jgi:hypothetical protein
MASIYDPIWNEIKQKGCAEIVVHKDRLRQVEHGVKLCKTYENVARRMAGLVGWSKLVIKRESLSDHKVKITFSLLYRTDL